MNRREFLQTSSMACGTLALAGAERLMAQLPHSSVWRRYEVITRVEVLKPAGTTRVWIPAALIQETPFQKTLFNKFTAEGGTAELVTVRPEALAIIAATFPAGIRPILTCINQVVLRDYSVDLNTRGNVKRSDAAELKYFLRPTKLIPTDGVVKATASVITKDARSDLEKAHAIYEWIVENTVREPKTRGCGRGDVRFMLESGDLAGKCADLNALYVGLARAAGLPARDVYGIRVAKSELGYKSLGVSSQDITKAQHCRAEVYLDAYGWVPVDPADVRKVMLEEPPGNRGLNDAVVKETRRRLFGSWEMNWMAYNFAHDVTLPGSNGAPVGFLMYPQAETANGRLDSLDPENFRYEIRAKKLLPSDK